MTPTTKGVIPLIAAFLILFNAMWDAHASAVIAIAALAGLGIYKLAAGRGWNRQSVAH